MKQDALYLKEDLYKNIENLTFEFANRSVHKQTSNTNSEVTTNTPHSGNIEKLRQ
jgi:hypothetical protein